jgi:hypothetical protein
MTRACTRVMESYKPSGFLGDRASFDANQADGHPSCPPLSCHRVELGEQYARASVRVAIARGARRN